MLTRFKGAIGALLATGVLAMSAAEAEEACLIGLNVEQTGHASSYGRHMMIAAEIAREQINDAGGVNGDPIEFVVEDNHTSPEQAVIATRNLHRKNVVAVLGPVQSSQARTAFPATNRLELVSVSPGSGAPGLTAQNRPWTFRNAAIDQVIIDELVAMMRQRYPDAENVAMVLDPKDAYQDFLVTVVSPPPLKAHGFNIMNEDSILEIPTETQDFSVHVTKLKNMKPDMVVLGLLYDRAEGFLREANRQDFDIPMIAGLGYITESVAAAAGEIDLFAGQPFDAGSQDPEVQAFVDEFRKRAKEQMPGQYTTPTYIDAGAYETIKIMADALRASGLDCSDGDREALRTAIRDYWARLEGYAGLGNSLSINEEGDAVKPTLIYMASDGEWQKL